jgi:hypothetical protein
MGPVEHVRLGMTPRSVLLAIQYDCGEVNVWVVYILPLCSVGSFVVWP